MEKMSAARVKTATRLVVQCLESEGADHVFGILCEEYIRLIDAMGGSKIHFIVIQSEQAGSTSYRREERLLA